ncbi:hypothetical protein [Methylobacterium aquaticum]|uniref:Uncharacterized protein n=1 Tax=Methylobacterium aquaticum TaxID=270351 RepID=A0A0C6FCH5_9HYPH|nr:hypothetical protein [Methylobacterium aquaticum]BAQ50406.1 hypothetical protein Maq22A_4p60280 [Methylobacterium aquaticum]
MGVMLYTVLAASGGFVNGAEVAIGAQIPLTDAEARYEIDLGNVAPTGREPPQPPLPPALLPTDLIETRRDRLDRDIVLAALDAYLVREGGALLALLAARETDLATRLTAQGSTLEGLRAALLGGAPDALDSLGKLATGIIDLRSDLAAAGAVAAQALAASADLRDQVGALTKKLTGTF